MQVSMTPDELVVDEILKVLGEPQNSWHIHALDEYNRNDAAVKITAATNLNDYYCYCLGFLINGKIPDCPLPKLRSSLKAAANAAAKYAEHRALAKLSDAFAYAFDSQDPAGEGRNAILEILIPDSDLQKNALEEFRNRDYDYVREMAKSHEDPFYKALIYLASASNSLPALPMVLGEAAHPAAEHVRRKTERYLNSQIAIAFGTDEAKEQKSENAIVQGLAILAKYYPDDGFAAEHDQIWYGPYEPGKLAPADFEKLVKLRWFEDCDSWSHHT